MKPMDENFSVQTPGNNCEEEKMRDLTLITCSYNTPIVVEIMLKSFVSFHGVPQRLILFENSTNDETAKLLDKSNVPYIRTRGGTHPKSVDEALKICATKYALVVDSDIVFKSPVLPLFDAMKKNDGAIMGEVCGDRGGYMLYERVHPWFMFVNVEKINGAGISFFDWERVVKTGSEGFYRNIPLQQNDEKTRYYDVGSTFFEDIKKAGLKIINCKANPYFFVHYEGMSWKKLSGIEVLVSIEKRNMELYRDEVKKHGNTDIKNFFLKGFKERLKTEKNEGCERRGDGKRPVLSAVMAVPDVNDTSLEAAGKLTLEMGPGDETIIVAAGSSQAGLIKKALPEKTGLKIIESSPGDSIAAMYNAGIAAAGGDIIIFTRDDIVCGNGFFEAHRAVHMDNPGDNFAAMGNIDAPNVPGHGYINSYLNGGGIEQADFGALSGVKCSVGPGFFNNSNVSLKRSILADNMLFDEFFTDIITPAREFGRRLFDRGMDLVFIPEIKAKWEHPLKFREYAEIRYREGKFYPYFADKMLHFRNEARFKEPIDGDDLSWHELIGERSDMLERLMKTGKKDYIEQYVSTMLMVAFFRGAKDAAAENSGAEKLFFEKGKWGVYKTGKNGGCVSVNSEYGPEREAKIIISPLPADKNIVFIGAGMGWHIKEYLGANPSMMAVLYEPHSVLFNYLKTKINMDRVSRITDREELRKYKKMGYAAVILPSLKNPPNEYSGAYNDFICQEEQPVNK